MTFSLRSLLLATTLSVSAVVASANSTAPGFVDFGTFAPAGGKQFVEVDLDAGLIKLASIFAQKSDPQIAELVSKIQRIRVNVIGMTDETRSATSERVESIRRQLGGQGWKRIATVQEEQGDNVGIYLKQANDDAIQGIVVTVLSRSNEAVLVNIVGHVTLEQIATLGERLNIQPLRDLNLAAK
jgi:hypothetical protein